LFTLPLEKYLALFKKLNIDVLHLSNISDVYLTFLSYNPHEYARQWAKREKEDLNTLSKWMKS
jgi:hypothetical protein